MSQERQGYLDYLKDFPANQRNRLIEILNTCSRIPDVANWIPEDAHIILGLHEAGTLETAIQDERVVRGVQTERDPSDSSKVRILPHIQAFGTDLLKGNDSQTIKALSAQYPKTVAASSSVYPPLASSTASVNSDGRNPAARPFLPPASSPAPATSQRKNYPALLARGTANLFWTKRNPGQRVAMYGLAAPAIAFAVAGALTTKSATLTTVGTAMGKILPSFITAFGASHAIPPAAIAFYVLAATLAAAALILFLASSLHRCAQNGKYKSLASAAFQPRPSQVASAGGF